MIQTWAEKILTEVPPDPERRAIANEKKRRQRNLIRFQPMTERVQNLIDMLPENERHLPRPSAFFTSGLRAKYPHRGLGHASAQEVGTALRELGWTRVRAWSGTESGFRATWHPPEGTWVFGVAIQQPPILRRLEHPMFTGRSAAEGVKIRQCRSVQVLR